MPRNAVVLRYLGIFCLVLAVFTGILTVSLYTTRPSHVPTPGDVYTVFYLYFGFLVASLATFTGYLILKRRQPKAGPIIGEEGDSTIGEGDTTVREKSASKPKTLADYQLSTLDMHLLRSLWYTKKEKELSKATGVDALVVKKKLDLLYTLRYITENTELTEKGYEAIKDMRPSEPSPSQRQSYSYSGLSQKLGMVLTIVGGCIFLFLGIIFLYTLLIAVGISTTITASSVSLFWTLVLLIVTFVSGILIIIGGFYVGFADAGHRKQGGVIGIASALISMIAALSIPLLIAPSNELSSTFAADLGAVLILYAIEFAGFVFVLIGAALGITFKGTDRLSEIEYH